MDMYHGTVIVKEDIGEFIKKGDNGVLTAYLPEENIFAVYFGENNWCTFHDPEEWFLEHFEIIQEI